LSKVTSVTGFCDNKDWNPTKDNKKTIKRNIRLLKRGYIAVVILQ